jgi:hypothetical protein
MGKIFNMTFSLVKLVFKAVFGIVGIVAVLLVGSCPD